MLGAFLCYNGNTKAGKLTGQTSAFQAVVRDFEHPYPLHLCYNETLLRVAQLDRASCFYRDCWGFDSFHAGQLKGNIMKKMLTKKQIKAMSINWIPIDEEKPKVSGKFLVMCSSGGKIFITSMKFNHVDFNSTSNFITDLDQDVIKWAKRPKLDKLHATGKRKLISKLNRVFRSEHQAV